MEIIIQYEETDFTPLEIILELLKSKLEELSNGEKLNLLQNNKTEENHDVF